MSSRLVDPAHVNIDLHAASRDGAVRAVAELLRGDARIGSWDAFWKSIGDKQVVDLKSGACSVCLAHGRDETVRDLVVAAGCIAENAGPSRPRLVFVFAIPAAMAEDYLRAVGALARACGDEKKMRGLETAATPAAFAAALGDLLG